MDSFHSHSGTSTRCDQKSSTCASATKEEGAEFQGRNTKSDVDLVRTRQAAQFFCTATQHIEPAISTDHNQAGETATEMRDRAAAGPTLQQAHRVVFGHARRLSLAHNGPQIVQHSVDGLADRLAPLVHLLPENNAMRQSAVRKQRSQGSETSLERMR